MEVEEFGIEVSIIEPGGIKTDWGIIVADKLADSAKGGAYEATMKVAQSMKKQYHSNLLQTNGSHKSDFKSHR